MNRFELYSVIYDFDDFIKSMFFDNNLCDYMNTDDYNYQLLTKGDKSSEQMLFLLLYKYILSFKNDMIDYSYYGYYNKKITNDISITYKANKNKIGIKINKNLFSKDVFDDWN